MSLKDRKILFFDFEVFKYLWLVVVKDYATGEDTVIINDVKKLQEFYEENKGNIWVGYNSREYDQYILKGILLGLDPWFINNEIIQNHKRGWQVVKDAEEYPLYNFDIQTGFHSLKQLEGFMGSMIKESDVLFDIDRPLTEEEIHKTVFYCSHDVSETVKVFEHLREEFDSQLLIIEAFDLPFSMFNKTKAQLAAVVLEAKRGKDRNDEFDLVFPPCLKIGEKYQHIVSWYKDPRNRSYDKSLVTDVAGVPHVFAWGGLHAAIPNYQGEGLIVHCDVASLYPSIMINYGFLSRNVPDPGKYREMRDKRLELKRQKNPVQLPLKIMINATFGAQKDQRNPLYDPRNANNICVGGQLLILDLIEKLVGHCELIQSNTDGLFLKVETEGDIENLKSIAREWETRTGLDLEWGVSRKIVQKDVNNYIVIEEDGEYESKGAYLKKLKPTDYDLPIINKALISYFINGTSIREIVEQCDELIEFQKVVRLTSKYSHAMWGDVRLKEKTNRVFASINENDPPLTKVKVGGDSSENIGYTPDHAFIFNDECVGVTCPSYLDKEYYVKMAESRLLDFLTPKKEKTTKATSGIKYINFHTKEEVDSINQEDYPTFSALAQHLICEKILQKRQLEILIKLYYFEQFGNPKELLGVLDILNLLDYGRKRSIKVEKMPDNELLSSIMDTLCQRSKKGDTYSLDNADAVFEQWEKHVFSLGISDFSWGERVEMQRELTGGIYPTHKQKDRPVLLVEDVRPVARKSDGKQFGNNIKTVSLGSGIKGSFTIMDRTKLFKRQPIKAGDVIYCIHYLPDGAYFNMTDYKILDKAGCT